MHGSGSVWFESCESRAVTKERRQCPIRMATRCSSGVASGIDAKFDNTTSAVAEVEYFWTPQIGMKMRYVKETFKGQGLRDVKANHFGISGNYYF